MSDDERPAGSRRVSFLTRRGDRTTDRRRRQAGLDTPLESRRVPLTPSLDPEAFGRVSETFARFMGTAWFIIGMTLFVTVWLAWNTFAPEALQFDPRELNYTLLTLILSLQASYAAPLILLAQNRQADRDRVSFEQDRQRSERGLADTEYLAREVAALRIALRDVATRDFLRSELRGLIEELDPSDPSAEGEARAPKHGRSGSKSAKTHKPKRPAKERPTPQGPATEGPAPEGAAPLEGAAPPVRDPDSTPG